MWGMRQSCCCPPPTPFSGKSCRVQEKRGLRSSGEHDVLIGYARDVRELLCTTDECNLFESGDSPFKLLREEEAGPLGRGPAYPPRHLHTEDGAHGQTAEEQECIPMRGRPWISRV
ncbi:hypothetical protein EYF80_016823 [Liparis tanakae]|uniref:Uncharacterized protein n=1 Tax=Liparis tanakae TaxID=230148 RepID=A0A4Z2I6F1_9TELE|nr:hypothetical protein EYF80_016823 [Liparis tanakae]